MAGRHSSLGKEEATMPGLGGHRSHSFWAAAATAVVLAVAAERLFFLHRIGSTLGAFSLAWLAATVILRPAIRRDALAAAAAAAAAGLGLLLVESPGLLGWTLFCAAIAVAALAP